MYNAIAEHTVKNTTNNKSASTKIVSATDPKFKINSNTYMKFSHQLAMD